MQNKVYEAGLEHGQLSAASTAAKEMSILTGHRIERNEFGGPGEFDHFQDDELKRMVFERFARLFGPKLAISDRSTAPNGGGDHDHD